MSTDEKELEDADITDLIASLRLYIRWLKSSATNPFGGIRGKEDCDKLDDGDDLLDQIEERVKRLKELVEKHKE